MIELFLLILKYFHINNIKFNYDLEFKNKDKGIIKIDPNMLVIFNGNLVHRVTKMNGSGIRKCIVIQFRRL